MAVSLLKLVADLQLSLAAAVPVGATTAELNTITDADGIVLPDGKYGFTIDGDTAQKEYIVCDLVGTNLTNVTNISRQGLSSVGFKNYHRYGATVTITDWAILSRMLNNLNGTTGFDSGTPLYYDGDVAGLAGNDIPTVNYVLSVVSGGNVDFALQSVGGQIAGESLSIRDAVYFNETDGKWYKIDADTPATFSQVKKGIALGTAILDGTVAIALGGVVPNFVGLTIGAKYFASATAGAITDTPTGSYVFLGYALSATQLLFTPPQPVPFASGATGVIVPFAGITPPPGFLMCDGSAISRTGYSALFSVIGTTWGAGDGSTTFNLPDLRGSTIIGAGTGVQKYEFNSATDVVAGNVSGVTVTASQAVNDYIVLSTPYALATGEPVYFSAGTLPPQLSLNTIYYAIPYSSDQSYRMATTYENAINGSFIDLSTVGSLTAQLAIPGYFKGKQVNLGQKITVSTTGSLPGGLSTGDYFGIRLGSAFVDRQYLATSLPNALSRTIHLITSVGSGTQTLAAELTSRVLGGFGGSEQHTLTVDEMPSHNHGGQVFGAGTDTYNGGSNDSTSMGFTGGDAPHNNMQPWVAMNWVIKT